MQNYNGIQRYKCKTCGCNYTKSTPNGYPIEVKREALRYYLEGIGFRRIERLPGVSHTAVIYWIKKAGEKIKYSFWRKKRREGRRSRAWRNVRKLKKIEQKKDFFVGAIDNSAFENLSKNIEH